MALLGMALAFLGTFIVLALIAPPAVEAQEASNPVQNLTLTQTGRYSFTATWDAPASGDALYYEVKVTDNGTGATVHRTIVYSGRSTDIGSLSDGVSYTVSVGVWFRNGGGFSDVASTTSTLGNGSVDNLTAISTSEDSISVSWKRPAYPQRIRWFNVTVFDTPPTVSVARESLDPSRLTARFSGLDAGTTYTVYVTIIEYGGGLAFHPPAIVKATTLPASSATAGFSAKGIVRGLQTAPSAPQNLQLSVRDESRLRVSWDAPATGWEPVKMREADSAYQFGYIVTLRNTETGETVHRRPGYKKLYVVFRKLESGITYEVSVQARIRDAQTGGGSAKENWVKSEWASGTVTVSN